MKTESEKQAVISLSDESFKHYLMQRYSNNYDDSTLKRLKGMSQDLISSETWIQLYNRAKADLEKNGGRLTGYEIIGDVLVSHDRINSHWPINWMWVLQFNQN